MTLTAIVLNFRTPGDTIRTVRSLRRDHPCVDEVILIDNASGGDSAERFARELPDVRTVVADSNKGFAGGCNLGIRMALAGGANSILLLNPDTIVPARALDVLNACLKVDATVGIAGPALMTGEVVHSLGITFSRRTGRMRHLGHGMPRSTFAPFQARTVDGISGAAMLVRRDVFERVGLLAEEFFFGFEDLEFCLRARDAGFATVCTGAAVVEHEGSVSIGRTSPRLIYFATRNHLLLGRRRSELESGSPRWVRIISILALNLAHVMFTARVHRTAGLRAFLRGMRDHFAGRYGPDVDAASPRTEQGSTEAI